MLARRMLLLVALLMGLATLAAAIAPDRRLTRESPAPAPREASPASDDSPAAASPAEQDAQDIAALPDEAPLETLDADRNDQVVHVAIDETLRLRVRSDALDSVQLGKDGPIEIVTPEAPARFELLVDAPLDLEVRLLEADRVIGRVTTQG